MIYFLRHAKTEYNYQNIISGQSDSPITCKPVLLSSKQQFELIYSSPSKRCIETISYLENSTTTPKYDDRLLERYMGTFEGKSKENLKIDFPNLFKETNKKLNFNLFETPPKGESYDCFYERVYSFYQECIVPNNSKNILICSHNQTLKMLYFIYTKTPLTFDSWMRINVPNGKIIAIDEISEISNK